MTTTEDIINVRPATPEEVNGAISGRHTRRPFDGEVRIYLDAAAKRRQRKEGIRKILTKINQSGARISRREAIKRYNQGKK